MTVRITSTPIPGVLVIETARYGDERGWFTELWNASRYRAAGLDMQLVQHNASWSERGVLRGMHFQSPNAQGKLITALRGAIFDAVVDIRVGSATYGRWYGCELSADNGRQIWVPEGFAHGFLVLSDGALIQYGCTAPYDAASDRSLLWNDETVGIEWPQTPTVVSSKDDAAPSLPELFAQGVLPSVETPDIQRA
ncbi:dTDP-4-dehydrorhamnose 3,5-epimerase [soil metagenome]